MGSKLERSSPIQIIEPKPFFAHWHYCANATTCTETSFTPPCPYRKRPNHKSPTISLVQLHLKATNNCLKNPQPSKRVSSGTTHYPSPLPALLLSHIQAEHGLHRLHCSRHAAKPSTSITNALRKPIPSASRAKPARCRHCQTFRRCFCALTPACIRGKICRLTLLFRAHFSCAKRHENTQTFMPVRAVLGLALHIMFLSA